MRRYFLVEKMKNSAIIGILVGTLGIAGYLSVIEQLRTLAKAAGKKTYTMLMGKPSPTKLANFPEVRRLVPVDRISKVLVMFILCFYPLNTLVYLTTCKHPNTLIFITF